MLRVIFVFSIIALGVAFSLKGPFYILLFYLWNAYFRPDTWLWTDILWDARLSGMIATCLLVASIPRMAAFKWNGHLMLIAAFLVQSGVSLALSDYRVQAFPYWWEFLKVITITVMIVMLVDTEERLRLTLLVIAFSLGLETVKQGWAQLIRNPGAANPNPHTVLGDNNGVALGMMMLLPIVVALSQTASTRWEKYIHRFAMVGIVYRGISTYSRGGFIAAGIVGFLTLLRSSHKIKTLIGAVLIAYVTLSVMPESFWNRMDTIKGPATGERDAAAQHRLWYWQLAMTMVSDHPIFGVGPNSYRYAFNRYNSGSLVPGEQRTVHSIWYGTLSELGYPGLLMFAGIIAMTLVVCQRARVRARRANQRHLTIYASQLQISIVAFAVGGTFLSQQYVELWWHLAGLVIALARVQAAAPVVAASTTVEPATPARRSVLAPALGPAGRAAALGGGPAAAASRTGSAAQWPPSR